MWLCIYFGEQYEDTIWKFNFDIHSNIAVLKKSFSVPAHAEQARRLHPRGRGRVSPLVRLCSSVWPAWQNQCTRHQPGNIIHIAKCKTDQIFIWSFILWIPKTFLITNVVPHIKQSAKLIIFSYVLLSCGFPKRFWSWMLFHIYWMSNISICELQTIFFFFQEAPTGNSTMFRTLESTQVEDGHLRLHLSESTIHTHSVVGEGNFCNVPFKNLDGTRYVTTMEWY